MASQIAFFALWARHFYSEMRQTMRDKAPRLYFWLFLCGNQRKLETQKQLDAFMEDSLGPYLAKYEEILSCKCFNA